MGLYSVDCSKCHQPFMWFSGNLGQVCDKCCGIIEKRNDMTTKEAMDKIRSEIKTDASYYYAWQSNIAMAYQDELSKRGYNLPDQHELANSAAKHFLDILLMDNNK